MHLVKLIFFSDVRRHSDRQLSTNKREYENIVYNDQGLPVILATHRGEKADEKVPFYQQNWLQGGNKPHTYNREPAVASILDRAKNPSSNGNNYYNNDPLLQSLIHGTKITQDKRKASLSFYEEKLINRDSGTDSPTANYYEDQNIFSLIQSLGNRPVMDRELGELYGTMDKRAFSPSDKLYTETAAAQPQSAQGLEPAAQGTKSSPIRVSKPQHISYTEIIC